MNLASAALTSRFREKKENIIVVWLTMFSSKHLFFIIFYVIILQKKSKLYDAHTRSHFMLIKSDFWPAQAARIFKKVSHQNVILKCTCSCLRTGDAAAKTSQLENVTRNENNWSFCVKELHCRIAWARAVLRRDFFEKSRRLCRQKIVRACAATAKVMRVWLIICQRNLCNEPINVENKNVQLVSRARAF